MEVVGAVIQNERGEVLCALRSQHMSVPGLWEFPGGKIEPGEAPDATLRREIEEELGCAITVGEQVEDTTYAYPAVEVRLMTYRARIVSGQPHPREHAELRWVPPQGLLSLQWAPADVPAVHRVLADTVLR
ncbi:MAG TPA: (deoxy)nucleoside triphosphate pyrophosphohydrolase [Symbiobacteriaceae bacterium]|nr:(deoxy)nucleoside triphosphate pyrophosphohydrolase [Symbiobacteriaceae bacterium]